ncbi:MAG: O-antigen ligase family protein [Planctomycetaceae bacterium]|nr:O-antigen ligase family protein [Planctomycetaceae bacterium]
MISSEPDGRPPLARILQVVGAISVFALLGWLTLRGLSLEQLMVPAAALGLPIYLIVLVDPILGLAILIACIGLSPEFSFGGVQNLRIEDFLVPGLLLGWMLRAGRERAPLAPTRLWTPALTAAAAMIFSTIAGASAGSAGASKAILILGKYAEYLAIYLLIINTVKTEAEVRALTIFAIMVALTSASLSFSGTVGHSGDTGEGRVHGPEGETSNIYGAYLGLHLLMALGLFLHTTSEGGRLLGGTAVVVLGIAILSTYSRTTYVAMGAAILVFGSLKHRRLLIILVILAFIIPWLAPASVTERLATVGGVASGPTPYSWAARLYAWQWAMNRMSPVDTLFGRGIGSVGFGDVDSEYVRIFSDTGAVGILLFGWLLLRMGKMANAAYNALPADTFPHGFMAGYLMGLVAIIVHAVAATTFSAIRTEETFMVLTGLMTVIANNTESLNSSPTDRPVVLLRNVAVLEPQPQARPFI